MFLLCYRRGQKFIHVLFVTLGQADLSHPVTQSNDYLKQMELKQHGFNG